MKKNIIVTILLVPLFGFGLLARTAYASEDSKITEAIATVEGGDLKISDYSDTMDFGAIKYDGNEQILPISGEPATGTITVQDLTGNFQGWNLQVNNTISETWDDGMVIRMLYSDETQTPVIVDLNAENQTFFSQVAENYNSSKKIDFKSTLIVPGSVRPGDYSTDITWTLSRGPEI